MHADPVPVVPEPRVQVGVNEREACRREAHKIHSERVRRARGDGLHAPVREEDARRGVLAAREQGLSRLAPSVVDHREHEHGRDKAHELEKHGAAGQECDAEARQEREMREHVLIVPRPGPVHRCCVCNVAREGTFFVLILFTILH